jgi:pterin-4a-carbinolamine dehydratase
MADDLDGIAQHTISRAGVPPDELERELESLGSRWSVVKGELRAELRGKPMAKCGAAVAYATKIADEMDHHPTIVVEYSGTTLTLYTHEQHAITMLDVVYAARFEKWLRDNGWTA